MVVYMTKFSVEIILNISPIMCNIMPVYENQQLKLFGNYK